MHVNLLSIRDLSKSFGGVTANHAIRMDVPHRGIVGLIGPNGSGKTTLFNSIVGAHPIDSGTIHFDGCDVTGLDTASIARRGLARTFQQASVYDGLTLMENMCVSHAPARESISSTLGRPDRALVSRACDLLEFAGLGEIGDEQAAHLSYGQRKLLEFAMALMSEPKMLLLDEPTAGVNPGMIDQLVERLSEARRSLGISLLVIEHNLRVVMGLADEIHCLAQGRVLASGSPAAIRGDPRVVEAYLGAT